MHSESCYLENRFNIFNQLNFLFDLVILLTIFSTLAFAILIFSLTQSFLAIYVPFPPIFAEDPKTSLQLYVILHSQPILNN